MAMDSAHEETICREGGQFDELLCRMAENAPFAVALLEGPEHRIRLANPLFREVARNKGEIINRTIADVWPESAKVLIPLLDRVYRTGEGHRAEDMPVPIDFGHGVETAHFTFSYTPLRDEAGRVRGIYALVQETTQQVQTRAERERLLTQLIDVQESVAEGLVILDHQGNIISMNSAARALLQVEMSEARHRTAFTQEWDICTPEGAPLPHDEWPVARVLRGQTFSQVELQLCHLPRGKKIWAVFGGAPLKDPKGEIIAAIVTLHDVTERVQTEQLLRNTEHRLRNILDSSQDALYRTNLKTGRHECLSPAIVTLTGFTPDEFRQMSIPETHSHIHPDDLPGYLGLIESTASPREQRTGTIEYRFLHKDGRYRWLSNHFTVTYDAQGEPEWVTGILRDVTQRIRVDQALRESEERYRSLFNNISEGFGLITILRDEQGRPYDFRCLEANPALGEFMGRSPQELTTHTWYELFPNTSPDWLQQFAHVEETGEPAHFQHYGDVSDRYCDAVATRHAPGQCAVVFRDISEQKRAEKECKELIERLDTKHARLQAILDALPVGVWVIDADGQVVHYNQGIESIWGGPPPFSRHIGDYGDDYRAWWPDSEERVEPHEWAIVRALTRGETVIAEEIEIETLDGRRKQILTYALPVQDPDSLPLGGVMVQVDVTDLKKARKALSESEERFRQLADAMPQLVWVGRPDGSLEYYNQRHQEFGGLFPQQDGTWDWTPTLHPDDIERTVHAWQHAVETGDTYEIEYRAQMADGSYRWFLTRSIPVRDEQGRITRWYGTTTDIDNLKRAEKALRELNETLELRVQARTAQLRALAAEIGQVEERERHRMARILHDHLQQLLVATQIQISIAQRTVPVQGHHPLDQAHALLDQAIQASRNLTAELSPPVLYDAGLPAALGWLSRWMHEAHGLIVDLQIDESVQVPDEGLRAFLFQSARELLFNVVKHAGVKHATLRRERSGDELLLTVKDDGVGFPDEGDWSDKGSFGLFGIRERLAYFGGSMEIETAPGRGTRVTIHMPSDTLRAGKEAASARDITQEIEKELTDEVGRIRVLVADDHRMMRQGLVALLEQDEEIKVIGEAADGRETLELAMELQPDIVLMDVRMPVMDGVAATEQIRQNLPETRVIGLSMFAEPEIAARMRHAGAAAYLTKSGDMDEVLHTIRRLINSNED
ncbi:MAG TPA: PAS domain-containing protein [Chloroflexi bacterium]|nr:PAS domain-containing protein [Chloroflexota bacterium]